LSCSLIKRRHLFTFMNCRWWCLCCLCVWVDGMLFLEHFDTPERQREDAAMWTKYYKEQEAKLNYQRELEAIYASNLKKLEREEARQRVWADHDHEKWVLAGHYQDKQPPKWTPAQCLGKDRRSGDNSLGLVEAIGTFSKRFLCGTSFPEYTGDNFYNFNSHYGAVRPIIPSRDGTSEFDHILNMLRECHMLNTYDFVTPVASQEVCPVTPHHAIMQGFWRVFGRVSNPSGTKKWWGFQPKMGSPPNLVYAALFYKSTGCDFLNIVDGLIDAVGLIGGMYEHKPDVYIHDLVKMDQVPALNKAVAEFLKLKVQLGIKNYFQLDDKFFKENEDLYKKFEEAQPVLRFEVLLALREFENLLEFGQNRKDKRIKAGSTVYEQVCSGIPAP